MSSVALADRGVGTMPLELVIPSSAVIPRRLSYGHIRVARRVRGHMKRERERQAASQKGRTTLRSSLLDRLLL
jgi:hypothetical protein